jgi:hypothetical protein
MLNQNRNHDKNEADRIHSLLVEVDNFCKKSLINVAEYNPTPAMQHVVANWINHAMAKNLDAFQRLSPTIRGVLGIALKKGLQEKLNQLQIINSF